MSHKTTPPGRDVPALYAGIAANAVRSRAAAVKLFCLECVGYVRKDVTDCTAHACPLYRWRPYQAVDDEADERRPHKITGFALQKQRKAEGG